MIQRPFTKHICADAIRAQRGQAVVEAAFLIPLLLVSLLLLIQPAILLYTSLVMQAAASECCRIVATESLLEQNAEAVKGYAMRRLAAVPEQDNFHVHEPTCTWNIMTSGNETTGEVVVSISDEVKPLPLFDVGLRSLGVLNERGNLTLRIEHRMTTKANWVRDNELATAPKRWVERWNDS